MSNPSAEAKCPFHATGGARARHGAQSNADWWPNQLNLKILHQRSAASNPMGEAFDYAAAFKTLDLDAVIADALSCIIPLDVEPAKPEFTQVKINGVKVPKVNSCAENGWVYTNPNGPYDAIELCGTACSDLKMSGKADVNFFCVPN